MWEGGGFSIETDVECTEFGGGEMCKHCIMEAATEVENHCILNTPTA